MSHNETTICALASSTGQGGIGIVRVSGARCIEIAKKNAWPCTEASLRALWLIF